MNLAAFLVGMVGPLVARLLASVGASVVVMVGITGAVSGLKATMLAQIGGLPADTVQLAGLFGIWRAVGMVLGAYTFALTWASTKGFIGLGKK